MILSKNISYEDFWNIYEGIRIHLKDPEKGKEYFNDTSIFENKLGDKLQSGVFFIESPSSRTASEIFADFSKEGSNLQFLELDNIFLKNKNSLAVIYDPDKMESFKDFSIDDLDISEINMVELINGEFAGKDEIPQKVFNYSLNKIINDEIYLKDPFYHEEHVTEYGNDTCENLYNNAINYSDDPEELKFVSKLCSTYSGHEREAKCAEFLWKACEFDKNPPDYKTNGIYSYISENYGNFAKAQYDLFTCGMTEDWECRREIDNDFSQFSVSFRKEQDRIFIVTSETAMNNEILSTKSNSANLSPEKFFSMSSKEGAGLIGELNFYAQETVIVENKEEPKITPKGTKRKSKKVHDDR